MCTRGVLRKGFWSGASTLKQHFVFLKNGSKYYLKYTFLVFPLLGILGLGTPVMCITKHGQCFSREGLIPIEKKQIRNRNFVVVTTLVFTNVNFDY